MARILGKWWDKRNYKFCMKVIRGEAEVLDR